MRTDDEKTETRRVLRFFFALLCAGDILKDLRGPGNEDAVAFRRGIAALPAKWMFSDSVTFGGHCEISADACPEIAGRIQSKNNIQNDKKYA